MFTETNKNTLEADCSEIKMNKSFQIPFMVVQESESRPLQYSLSGFAFKCLFIHFGIFRREPNLLSRRLSLKRAEGQEPYLCFFLRVSCYESIKTSVKERSSTVRHEKPSLDLNIASACSTYCL